MAVAKLANTLPLHAIYIILTLLILMEPVMTKIKRKNMKIFSFFSNNLENEMNHDQSQKWN